MTITERTRLAQELHDGIAQDLVGLGYSIDLILTAPATPTLTRIELRKTRFAVSDLLDKVRYEIHDLYQINDAPIAVQIANTAEEICGDLEIEMTQENIELASDSEVTYQVLRIVRELLRNIVHHAGASKVSIVLFCQGNLATLIISDDGADGLHPLEVGFGMRGCSQRAESIGATLSWNSSTAGTEAQITFPIA